MTMKKKIGKILLLISILLAPAIARGETQVSAFTDKQTVSLNEYIVLTVSVSGDNANSAVVQMPSMANFSVSSSGRASQISIINGRINSSVEYTYFLNPRYIGKTAIPPISVSTGKEKFLTKEIEITVTAARASQSYPQQQGKSSGSSSRASNRPARGTPLENLVFVKAETDKKTAYPGEQINLIFRFYTAVPIARNPEYYPPKFSNLFPEDLPPVASGEKVINGVKYYYSEMKTALFALNSGKASIGPIEIAAQVQKEEDIDPMDPNFMQKFFSGFTNYEEIRLKTKPIDIDIVPLPENAPADFSGAVGNFFISSSADRKEVKQGEPVNLTVKITGKGNIKDISVPALSGEGIKLYDSLSSYSLNKHDGIVGGEKKITYIISFKDEGLKEIPPVKFSFFNIDTKKYETLETSPLKIKVLKAEASKSYDFSSSRANAGVQVTGADIKYLLDYSSGSMAKLAKDLAEVPLYSHFFFAALLAFAFMKNRAMDEMFRDPKLYSFRKAHSEFLKAIARSSKEQDASRSLAIIYDALMDYFSAKLMDNIYSLPINKIADKYREKYPSAGEFTLNEIKALLEEIEFLNYASAKPQEAKLREVRERAETLCEMIEKEADK